MPQIIMSIKGGDGQIDLMNDRVVIHRKGIWNMFKHGINVKKEIPLGAITTINFRDASALRFGEIDFSYGGRSQSDKKKENAVIFNKKQQEEFVALKEKMFELMQQQQRVR